MKFLRIRGKKDWHFIYHNQNYSACGNASIEPIRYPKGRDKDNYCDVIEAITITREMQDNLCQACVRQAYKDKLIRVQLK